MPNTSRTSNPTARLPVTPPSRQERRDNFFSQRALCWACGNAGSKGELKVCAKCKVAYYCNTECQRTHWRATHKSECTPAKNPHINDVIRKLAGRASADPYISHHLACASILVLDLLTDKRNATRFAVNVVCSTAPADTRTRAPVQGGPDPNAPIRLVISSIRRVRMEDASRSVQDTASNFRKNIMHNPTTSAIPTIVTAYFSCSSPRVTEGEAVAVFEVDNERLMYMASNPKLTSRSPVFGDRQVDMDLPRIQMTMDDYIEMDRDNKLRLRVHPNGNPLSSKNNARK